MNPNHQFKVVSYRTLDHDHRHVLSLLYLPIIGTEAFGLYQTLYALIERSHLRSPQYPHAFLYDVLNVNGKQFLDARQKLEACGLLESYQQEDDYLYELFLPLHADLFIKDSPFAPYLLKQIGQQRFDDLIEHFKIKRPQLANYDMISVTFDEIFTPAYDKITTRSTYVAPKRKDVTINHSFSVELLLDSLPNHLTHPTTKTKRVKERLSQMAYIYALDEEHMHQLILSSLNPDTSINFAELIKQCQKEYQEKPKNQYTRKTSGYDLDYFKATHPKNIVEDLTGMHVPAADLKIIERILAESEMKLEVINVLVAYVLKELDNQFPVFNYFEKVIAEWKRSSIDSAEDAIEHIKKRKQKRTERKKQTTYRKQKTLPKDVEVDWFDDYLKEKQEE